MLILLAFTGDKDLVTRCPFGQPSCQCNRLVHCHARLIGVTARKFDFTMDIELTVFHHADKNIRFRGERFKPKHRRLLDRQHTFTFGLNRPLHVFDVAKVQGGALRVHAAAGGEAFLALDGKTYTLRPGMMAISDAAGVESLAGIMGGEHSGCTEETVDVFLESAFWDPITIATTGRALKINSDARYRFERGVDPAFTLPGLDLATQMILDLCGGEASDLAVDGAAPDTSRAYKLNPARVISLVGMDIPEAEQRRTLEALGFTLNGDMATPPTWRPDVLGEADLVARMAPVASALAPFKPRTPAITA